MKILSIDFAMKTGWAYGEIKDKSFDVQHIGKFKSKGNSEKEKILSLMKETRSLLKQFDKIDIVVFEDSISGGMTSLKTLRSTFGKRYTLIGLIGEIVPNAKIYTIRPNEWSKHLPEEFYYSNTETTSKGNKVRAKGKEKKENVVNFVNSIKPNLKLVWLNERVDCENDIADAVAIGEFFCNGVLENPEEIG